MHILITGKNGFIGSNLQRLLSAHGHTFVKKNYDVLAMPKRHRDIDAVVHLASQTDNNKFFQDSEVAYKTNICGTLNVLEFCKKSNTKLVYISTCGVYAEKVGKVRETDDIEPRNPYTFSKYIGEQLCSRYSRDFGLPIIILRLFNVYGFGQRPPFVIPYIFECLLKNRPIELKSPLSLRDFIYVDDVCASIVKALARDQEGIAVFNIGSGKTVSVARVAKKISALLNKELPRLPVKRKENNVPCICADLTRTSKYLVWKPSVVLDDGLKRIRCQYQGHLLKRSRPNALRVP